MKMSRPSIPPVFVLSAALLSGAPAEVVDDWSFLNPVPTISNLFNGAYGNGTYVILSNGTGIHRTTDFQTWSSTHGDLLLQNVIFADSMFLASGTSGEILRSSDGTHWTQYSSGTTAFLCGLAYGGGRYVTAGEDGISSTSTDGMTWTPGTTGDGNTVASMAYGEGRFVAVTYAGTILTTTDGVNWSPATVDGTLPPGPQYNVVAYGAGRFIVGGYYSASDDDDGVLMLSSEDGLNFTRVIDPNLPNAFATSEWVDGLKWDGNRFIAAGDAGLVMVSTDGLTWSVRNSDTTTDLYAVIVGENETAAVGRRGTFTISSDLLTWTESTPDPGLGFLRLDTLAHDGSGFVLGGRSGVVHYSSDGENWINVAHPGSILTQSTHGEGRWVLASSFNFDDVPLITSTNGTAWEIPALPPGIESCNGVAHGNGTFAASVAIGPNRILISDDGATWTGVDPPGLTTCRGMAFGGGQFVTWTSAVDGDPIRVAVSANGQNWTVHDTPLTSGALLDAAFGDGRWTFVGTSGVVLGTTDFTDWNNQQLAYDLEPVFGTPSPRTLQAVAHHNGHWVITGQWHQFWSSTDGQAWVQAFTTGLGFNTATCYDLTVVGDRFWAVGDSGVILVSEPISGGVERGPATLLIRREGPSSVALEVTGQTGDDWVLMFRADSPEPPGTQKASFTLEGSPFVFTDPLSTGGSGFYWLQPPAAP